MHMKLLDPQGLAGGSERQKQAFEAITKLRLFEVLRDYSPVLAGALPLGVEIESTPVEIYCSCPNLEEFATTLTQAFQGQKGFRLNHSVVESQPSVMSHLEADGFSFEILGQSQSVFTQTAVNLMLIEARLLTFAPREVRDEIRTAKRAGESTEAAFAKVFELKGPATEELLKISRMTDRDILNITHRYRFQVH